MLEIGRVVCATAGRDKDRFFVVLGREGDCALIADGKRRKCETPKKKKEIHLRPTRTVAQREQIVTNRAIRTVLRSFGTQDSRHECEEV